MKSDGKSLTIELVILLTIGLLSLVSYPIVKISIEKKDKESFINEVNSIIEDIKNDNKISSDLLTYKIEDIQKISEYTEFTGGQLYYLNGNIQLAISTSSWCAVKRYEDKAIFVEAKDGDCYIDKSALVASKSIVIVDSGDGLYESSDEYIYKGVNPNNYIALKINGVDVLYRIIDISKKGELKIIRNEVLEDHVWGGNDNYSVIKDDNIGYYLNTSDIANEELLALKNLSYVSETNILLENIDNISQGIEKTENMITAKISLLNLIDYLNSSSDNVCKIKSTFTNCQKSNWLVNNSDFWTLTEVDQDNKEAYIINEKGNIIEKAETDMSGIRPVVYLNQNITLMGIGSKELPYRIKN